MALRVVGSRQPLNKLTTRDTGNGKSYGRKLPDFRSRGMCCMDGQEAETSPNVMLVENHMALQTCTHASFTDFKSGSIRYVLAVPQGLEDEYEW